jgi:uncharacterized protein
MNTRVLAVLALAAGTGLTIAATPGEPAAGTALPITREYGVMVPMRDGVRLATDVFRPSVPGRFPVVITRTPYNRSDERDFAIYFARHGYVALTQDVRGRYDSEGEWYPLVHEADDGYDVQEWAARQPWSNGQVLLYGSSYGAIQQWLSATRRSPHLAAMSPQFTPSDPYAGWVWVGGAFQEAIAVTWSALVTGRVKQSASLKFDPWPLAFKHLPVTDALRTIGHNPPFYRDWLAHPTRDAYWRAVSWRDSVSAHDVPAFIVGSWYDIFNVRHGTIDGFQTLRANGPVRHRAAHRLVIGPWEHGPHGTRVGEVEFGPQSTVDLDALLLRWFDHVVKGVANGADKDPPVRLFTMGENAWHDYDDWPVPGTRLVSHYLRGGGRANGASGDGRLENEPPPPGEKPDRYSYDPRDPVPNAGGGNCCWPELLPWGPLDQRAVERRDDVLVYSTPPLERDLRVTGRITARLWVASSAADTDFTVKLVDVFPSGFAMNLTDGILRVRYRASFETPRLLDAGKPVEITVEVGDTSNLFQVGHRLRVEIASANFPRYSRNTNTGRQPETDLSTVAAHQVVFHDAAHPSRVEIPVLP